MLKRIFDVFFAGILFLILLPVFIFLCVMIRVRLGKGVFFIQPRPGLHGKIFHLYKFRTMRSETSINGVDLPDSERMTKFGQILRQLSLDEIPQLINVLLGDMSLVGPRPLLVEYLPLYTIEQARRHDVRPGVTGWAQVNGRNAISWPEKFKLDVWYVENQSFWLDIKILLLTAKKVFLRDGVSAAGHVTTEKFKGEH